jgi:hypothetical protein
MLEFYWNIVGKTQQGYQVTFRSEYSRTPRTNIGLVGLLLDSDQIPIGKLRLLGVQ